MIKEVRLVNVKSYSDQTIKFEEGVNAIIGENGAGKTTILEAIGFALFNTLPYNISDFVRRGERRAEIRVRIVNPKDERLYEIVRRIEDGRTVEYFVRDAETGMRIGGAEGVSGVLEWVKDAFGFEVDAKTVFENAIGVSQGKITSQFLESPSVRDRIFSPLIGVEGYKKAFEKSREYERHLENKLRDVESEIALLKRDVENLNRLKIRLEGLKKERDVLIERISDMKAKISPIEERLKDMERALVELSSLKVEEAKLTTELEGLRSNIEQLEKELERLKGAEDELNSLRDTYENYVRAERELEELERSKRNLEEKIEDLRKKEIRLERTMTELENLRKRLEEIERCEEELGKVETLASREEELMEKLREIEIAESKKRSLEEQKKRIEEELEGLRKKILALEEKEKRLEVLMDKLSKIPEDIEEKRDKLIQAIAKLRQMLQEEERQFEKIKSGKCPILGVECERIAKVAKVKEEKITKIRSKMKDFERRLKICDNLCRKKRQFEEEMGIIRAEIEAKDDLMSELSRKEELLEAIRTELEEVEKLIGMKEKIEEELKSVRGAVEKKIALMDKVRRKADVLREIKEKRREMEELSKELIGLDDLKEQLEGMRRREAELREVLRSIKDDYLRFVRLKEEIERRKDVESKLKYMKERMKDVRTRLESVRAKMEDLKGVYDEEEFQRLRDELQKLREKKSKLEGELSKLEVQMEEIEREVEECRKKEEELSNRLKDREKLVRKLRFVRDLREIFRRAIPEITKAYVEAVSVEANRIFCEIMGDYNWELRWTEDFGIKAKYMGREIDFAQMSGGEQVCAALSVRLALLKVLSNMRVVFFDEPTQNMDETRRRNFATQLARIEGFRQIFVISHDDTFEEMVENAIKIRKENGISVVI